MSKIRACRGCGEIVSIAMDSILESQSNEVVNRLDNIFSSADKRICTAMTVNDPRFSSIVKMFQDVLKNDPVLSKFPEKAQQAGLLKWLKANAPKYMVGLDANTLQNIFDAVWGKPIVNFPKSEPVPEKEYKPISGKEGDIINLWHNQPDSQTMMRGRGVIPSRV